MKRLFFALACTISVFCFCACSSDDKDEYIPIDVQYNKMIIGTWVKDSVRWGTYLRTAFDAQWESCEGDKNRDTLTFKQNGPCTINDGSFPSDVNWELKDTYLTVALTMYDILSLTDNRLYLYYTPSDIQYIYRKIK